VSEADIQALVLAHPVCLPVSEIDPMFSGEYARRAIIDDWVTVKDQLGGNARLVEKDGRPRIVDSLTIGPLSQAEVRKTAFAWLAERVNTFVNVMRPRVRSVVADYQSRGE
jgi:hypothetical protein